MVLFLKAQEQIIILADACNDIGYNGTIDACFDQCISYVESGGWYQGKLGCDGFDFPLQGTSGWAKSVPDGG